MAYIGPVSAVPSDLRDLLAKALTESSDYAVVLVVPEDVALGLDRQEMALAAANSRGCLAVRATRQRESRTDRGGKGGQGCRGGTSDREGGERCGEGSERAAGGDADQRTCFSPFVGSEPAFVLLHGLVGD
jgi:hypothetical protein